MGWCMCRAQAKPALVLARLRLELFRKMGLLWLVAAAIAVSWPQMSGNEAKDMMEAANKILRLWHVCGYLFCF